ncbi:anti-sigma factor family protein [Phyllobacterium myrsinacearum]|uniref:Anti-sigma factor RsiW n=1 Tax=Phyllobacterium myrsinacearum TaxID=28101 RepID=A0A839EV95_9HYPH|nr:anti-sigma factor [Phyllobacterium myrsinacearum]MBA8881256.1 anti-sigma factor RsiW [Phyllobacterium myrsinacearum]
MTDPNRETIRSDEMLVAFLDGELDSNTREQIEHLIESDDAVAERLRFLMSSSLPFRDAFDPLLDKAPKAKLEALLAEISPPVPVVAEQTSGWTRRGFLAAAVGFIAVGVAVDRTFLGVQSSLHADQDGNDWRSVVAQYMSLYTSDTLGRGPVDVAAQTQQLRDVGAKLGLSLTPERVQLPGATLKRAQMLAYDGNALGQITYLDAMQQPMALCIVQSSKGAKAPDSEHRHGMNVVYWSNDTHAFMLIGHESLDDIKAMSDRLRQVLTA